MSFSKLIIKNPLYPFRHWLTTLAIAPLLLFIFTAIRSLDNFSTDTFGIYIVFMMLGFFLSFPTFVAYYFLYLVLLRRGLSSVYIKTILGIEAILGMFITLWLTGGTSINDLYLPYFIAIIISSLFYKIDKITE